MLKRFEVENFKNFKDKFVFDLSETKNYEFNPECVQNGLVNKALIYGVNGCGKSNLGLAILDFSFHLSNEVMTNPELYENYLNADSLADVAKFKLVFQFDGVEVEYAYEKKTHDNITCESLKIDGVEVIQYTVGKPLITKLKGTEALRTDLSDSRISSVIKYIAFNSVLDQNETNKAFMKFFNFAMRMSIAPETASRTQRFTNFILEEGHLSEFEEFLNEAGVACKLTAVEINGEKEIAFAFGNKTIGFWDAASTGTKSLARFYFQLQLLKNENLIAFIFIDEFDAFYHHKLSQLIVRELRKTPAQVILTTHNTSIMTNDLLRPDCYFVMHENKIDPIYKFTDKELRFAHNIEKMYKAGAFDG
ncbi:MAG: ATP-binding protein [Gallionella sp.]|nr:ATP-binding protein [Gallionella sp.]MDD4958932.1 ATP-binding protein [Gallionella sp.]